MLSSPFSKLIVCLLFIFPCLSGFSSEENFFLINGQTDEIVLELGPHINERISPCSSFKIILSLMGYDAGILKDEKNPVWEFQDGYDDFLESWKAPISPQFWMNYSCFWYSKLIALQLGIENIQSYLISIEYGNKDMSGGITQPGPGNVAWVNSSLTISPKEQVSFIQNMLQGKLSISNHAIEMTKILIFKEELTQGWKLFGKTGWSGSTIARDGKTLEYSWFVGWIEKDPNFYPFAYLIRDKKINLEQRIPRVKQLLIESNVMTEI